MKIMKMDDGRIGSADSKIAGLSVRGRRNGRYAGCQGEKVGVNLGGGAIDRLVMNLSVDSGVAERDRRGPFPHQ